MDGMIINGLQVDGAMQSYLNDADSQEMVYQTGGGGGDSPTGGVRMNLVPERGRQPFSGSIFLGVENWQSDNFTQDAEEQRRDERRQDRARTAISTRPRAARSRRIVCGSSDRGGCSR